MPLCGDRSYASRSLAVLAASTRVMVALLLIEGALALPSVAQQPASKAVPAERDFIGCHHLDTIKKAIELFDSGDREASNKFRLAAFLTGECVLFKKGEPIFNIESSIVSGAIKVRKQGSPVEFWTIVE
jgi:hypothetical protein